MTWLAEFHDISSIVNPFRFPNLLASLLVNDVMLLSMFSFIIADSALSFYLEIVSVITLVLADVFTGITCHG